MVALQFTAAHPLVLPAVVVAVATALILMNSASRALRLARWQSFVLLASTGGVLALTLTPARFRSWGAASISDVEVLLNVMMFVPIGFIVALVPHDRYRWALALVAVLMPFGIEALQNFVHVLNRYPRWIDIAANVAGVLAGFGVAAVLRRVRSPGEPRAM